MYDDPSAMAVLSATQNNSVHGVATFVRKDGDVLVSVNMAGFKPNTMHGLHIHDSGDCSARDGASAGEHFNPASSQHGGASGSPRHSGDLGNVASDSSGRIFTSFTVKDLAFGNGTDSIIGRGLVVHADRDDLSSQPAGNSGARIACGVITRNPDRMTYAKAG
ncbi:MAG TPA: superoxide dismutase family protein [Burkholderiales bacterium]|nr:superoxide dismutase family protein [Burkholderiales bacterium]